MAKTKAAFAGVTFDADPADELVRVRVLRRGDGKISTGQHDPQGGDYLYEAGDIFSIPRYIAEIHATDERGYVEILPPEKPKAPEPEPEVVDEAPEPERELPASFDQDGDGHPGGGVPAKRGPGRPPKAAE